MVRMKHEHTLCVNEIVDSYSPIALDQIRRKLVIKFIYLMVNKTAFYNHVFHYCALIFKQLERLPEKWNSEKVKLKQKAAVLEWMSDKTMDFEKKISKDPVILIYFCTCVYRNDSYGTNIITPSIPRPNRMNNVVSTRTVI